jgi:hypothetical protein
MPSDERLPHIDELPQGTDGYERDAVASAFAAFEHRIGELEGAVEALRPVADELRALRGGALPPVYGDLDDEAWHAGNGSSPRAAAPLSVGLPPPLPRPHVVPRVLLEAAFLGAVAVIAAIADLEPAWIALVMLGAWLLVAISEWAAYARQRRWHLDEVAEPLVDAADPAWYVPPVESTMIEPASSSESHTIVAALPQPVSEDTQEHSPELEPEPRRRWFRLRRKRRSADPWEA